MRIGELAARAGVNSQTILFYERRRLLPRPSRTPGGYRAYTESDLARVEFIRQTQRLGFTLSEIAALLPIHGSPGQDGRREGDKAALFRMVAERLAQVEAQIVTLERLRDALRQAIDQDQSRVAVCPASGYTGPSKPPPAASPRRRKKKA